jgi:hypothetical protein
MCFTALSFTTRVPLCAADATTASVHDLSAILHQRGPSTSLAVRGGCRRARIISHRHSVAMDVVGVQSLIKAQAEEQADAAAALLSWTRDITRRDEQLRGQSSAQQPLPRQHQQPVPAPRGEARGDGAASAAAAAATAASHTYDKGYKRWENFDAVRNVGPLRQGHCITRMHSGGLCPAMNPCAVPRALRE